MKLFTAILTMLLTLGFSYAAGFEKSAKFRTTTVHMSSQKPLTIGINSVTFDITQKGKALDGAEVKVKIFMPAMPGMPRMEATSFTKSLGNGQYSADLAFSMGGTWQIHIFVITDDGKKYRIKSSVNI